MLTVYIKRVEKAGAVGTYVHLEAVDAEQTVSKLAERYASVAGVNRTLVRLHLVNARGPVPTVEEERLAAESPELFPRSSLAAASVSDGSLLLACVSTTAPERPLSPLERFRALLSSQGLTVDEGVLESITRSGTLSAQVSLCDSASQAAYLYEFAESMPRSKTRASVARKEGILVDGVMLVPGVQTALFFHAFTLGMEPRVLKVPLSPDKAARECRLWQALELEGGPVTVPLVRVSLLSLRSGTLEEPGSEPRHFRQGVLMPLYACSLSAVPVPAEAPAVARILSRVASALSAVHAARWMHGDVKPGNILLDAQGDAWLGDYGCSCPFDELGGFTGGTPAFQMEVVDASRPELFDRVGLAVSMLNLLGLLHFKHAPDFGWPAAAVEAALGRVEDAPLRLAVQGLLQGAL